MHYNIAVDGLTDSGTVIASIPAGAALGKSGVWNYESASADNTILFDNTAPSDPTPVTMYHVIPTSRNLHAKWTPSTDNDGIQCYRYRFGYTSGGNDFYYADAVDTTSTQATYTIPTGSPGIPSIADNRTYWVKVKAIDNAGNESAEIKSSGLSCAAVSAAYYWDIAVDNAFFIGSYISSVALATEFKDANNRMQMSLSMPGDSTIPSLDSLAYYDVIFIACPKRYLSSSEKTTLATWAQDWHRRIVLIGEGFTFPDNIKQIKPQNERLNDLASSLGTFYPFDVSGNLYDSGSSISRSCPVNSNLYTGSPKLMANVWGLRDNGAGTFGADGGWLSHTYNMSQCWVTKGGVANGGSGIAIHDMNLFDSYYKTPAYGGTDTEALNRNMMFVRNLLLELDISD